MAGESSGSTTSVAVYVGDHRLEGKLYVGTNRGGERLRRVSDILNGDAAFIALTDVAMTQTHFPTAVPVQHEIVILRKGEIKFAIPLD